MSDTQPADIFSTEAQTLKVDGEEITCTAIRFGTPEKTRTLTIRDAMGPGTYLDALEVYGGTKSDEAQNLAMLAFRVMMIDGHPPTPPRDRTDIHRRLNKIGNDGINAIVRAISGVQSKTADQATDTVGNS